MRKLILLPAVAAAILMTTATSCKKNDQKPAATAQKTEAKVEDKNKKEGAVSPTITPVAPTGEVKAPAAPTGEVKAPVAPTGEVKAPAAPTGEVKASAV